MAKPDYTSQDAATYKSNIDTEVGYLYDTGLVAADGSPILKKVDAGGTTVNYLEAVNAITNNPAILRAAGTDTDIDIEITPKGAGRVVVPWVGCSLHNTTNISLTNATTTPITWNSEHLDTNGFHSTASNTERITIPSGSGITLVEFVAQVRFAANSTGRRVVTLLKNGGSEATHSMHSNMMPITDSGIYTDVVLTSGPYECTGGDYFQINAYQASGSTINALATGLRLKMTVLE